MFVVDYENKFIGFTAESVPEVKDETKYWTYRIGGKFDFLEVGDTLGARDSSTEEIFARLLVTDKEKIPFIDLPLDRPGHEVYESKEEQRQVFEGFYPGRVTDDVIVTAIGFKILKAEENDN